METIYDFDGRLLYVKTYEHIYEQLARDREKLLYQCVAEMPHGIRLKFYQPLSDEDVRTLLADDVRKPENRLDWTKAKDRFAREKGMAVEVVYVSARDIFLRFTCHLVDEQMTSIPYSVLMPIRDYVYIVDCVNEYFMLEAGALQYFRTDLYELLTDSKYLPRPLTPTTWLLLTSAEETACCMNEDIEDG